MLPLYLSVLTSNVVVPNCHGALLVGPLYQ